MAPLTIRSVESADGDWVDGFIRQRWGAPIVAAHGRCYRPRDLPGFLALERETPVGLVTYQIDGERCEIVSIDALQPFQGVGTALLEAVKSAAGSAACRRLCLITTNDNLDALRFWQRRGFALIAVHRCAVKRSRELKPQIPLIGRHGIPIRDEIELEMPLVDEDNNAFTA